ncbi:hypothetical protein D3C71_1533170 [compost metagenome]
MACDNVMCRNRIKRDPTDPLPGGDFGEPVGNGWHCHKSAGLAELAIKFRLIDGSGTDHHELIARQRFGRKSCFDCLSITAYLGHPFCPGNAIRHALNSDRGVHHT